MRYPRYEGLQARSPSTSAAGKSSSKKAGSKAEITLAHALWRRGFRYRKNARPITGCPDLMFRGKKVLVFVDGDFWHGRNWAQRKKKLLIGHNADYWVRKIEKNMTRDLEVTAELVSQGWTVVRVWEHDILKNQEEAILCVERALRNG